MREKVGLLTKDVDVEPKMMTWNLFMFVIHKHKISESWSSVSTDLPRLNLSDAQTLMSDRLARIDCFCDGFSEMFVNHKHNKIFGIAPVCMDGNLKRKRIFVYDHDKNPFLGDGSHN